MLIQSIRISVGDLQPSDYSKWTAELGKDSENKG